MQEIPKEDSDMKAGDVEEEVKVNIPKSPEAPTKAEIEEHQSRAHIPYRSWCECCVKGRKKNLPHRRVTDSDHEMPTVSLDYGFLRDHDTDKTLTCLVCKDHDSKTLFADVCPSKGAD